MTRAWQTWSALQRFGQGGVYLNFAGLAEEKEVPVRTTYGVNSDRLVAVQAICGPGDLFRMNQHIKPRSAPVDVR
ncbi:MAG: hypothetical protein ACJ75N_05595 [Actinomycetes bacterium]